MHASRAPALALCDVQLLPPLDAVPACTPSAAVCVAASRSRRVSTRSERICRLTRAVSSASRCRMSSTSARVGPRPGLRSRVGYGVAVLRRSHSRTARSSGPRSNRGQARRSAPQNPGGIGYCCKSRFDRTLLWPVLPRLHAPRRCDVCRLSIPAVSGVAAAPEKLLALSRLLDGTQNKLPVSLHAAPWVFCVTDSDCQCCLGEMRDSVIRPLLRREVRGGLSQTGSASAAICGTRIYRPVRCTRPCGSYA